MIRTSLDNPKIPVSVEHIDQTLKAMGILQRLAGECQQRRDLLPDEIITILSEWESFSEG